MDSEDVDSKFYKDDSNNDGFGEAFIKDIEEAKAEYNQGKLWLITFCYPNCWVTSLDLEHVSKSSTEAEPVQTQQRWEDYGMLDYHF